MDNDKKKYNALEPILQKINKNIISLSDEDTKRSNDILNQLLTQIIEKMKEKDSLFREMSARPSIFYGGSFYDGLKVANPDEYDLDLLLTLPSSLKYKLAVASNVPGFVHLKFLDYTPSMKKLESTGKHKKTEKRKTTPSQNNSDAPRHYYRRKPRSDEKWERGMDRLINANHYLDTAKVLQWMQSVVQLAFNTFEKQDKHYILKTSHGIFLSKISKSGPAWTLKASGTVNGQKINLDIDLVPCFVFTQEHWPEEGGFRKNPVNQKPNFFIVPKQYQGITNSDVYWRLSFQEQERALMESKAFLKPTIKLLKKMRDRLQHKKIASYYLKTVALWTIEEEDASFWSSSLSYVFMTVLKKYQKCLENGKIPYYWNKNYNLLEKINPKTLENISNKIQGIIDDIDRNLGDPTVVVKYLLTQPEKQRLL